MNRGGEPAKVALGLLKLTVPNRRWWVVIAAVMVLVAGTLIARHVLAPAPTIPGGPPAPAPPKPAGLPGMAPVPDPHNIYADAGANMLSPAVPGDPALVYVAQLHR